ncbi:hypothetical protein, partial [Salmonella sp. s55044]|uniref:hypothetical protein n=1 Tax=Salmonella sp. s55044 TaxID=3159677 RepID=UPI0039816F44
VVPASDKCRGTGWTMEYSGYMMSSSSGSHYRAEYICVDDEAEGIPRTSANNNEAMLYVVTTQCGSSGGGLPCPPYANGLHVLCAVCTI